MLSRVDFGKAFFDKTYDPRSAGRPSTSFFKGSLASITGLEQGAGPGEVHLLRHRLHADDVSSTRRDSTSSTTCSALCAGSFWARCRTWVFDVHPKADVTGMGRFYGRIWIEDQDGNVVRFNGTYTGPTSEDARSIISTSTAGG